MNRFLIVLFLSFSFYQAVPQSSQSIFEFDYAQFGYDSVSNYLEIYYSFNQSRLTPGLKDNKKILEGLMEINISDSLTGKLFINKEWKIESIDPAYKVTNFSDIVCSIISGYIGIVNRYGWMK